MLQTILFRKPPKNKNSQNGVQVLTQDFIPTKDVIKILKVTTKDLTIKKL
jgi:hypothetical protein